MELDIHQRGLSTRSMTSPLIPLLYAAGTVGLPYIVVGAEVHQLCV